jgi:type III pantothenate kinase
MILLLDIGNTNTHVGLANGDAIGRTRDIPTVRVCSADGLAAVRDFVRRHPIVGAVLASVVPAATVHAQAIVTELIGRPALELNPTTLRGVDLDYPRPQTIGQDRLANAIAVHRHFGAPSVVVDFGTAVTFDVVSREGAYVGGIIAPGLACMTDYLHEKTALLPRIRVQEPRAVIGRNTKEAMLVGAVYGYRGLVRELIRELRAEMRARKLPVVATGGYAAFMAEGLPEITAVRPNLTLEGLRILWELHRG